MGVPYGARRQRPAILAAGFKQGRVPIVNLRRAEFLQQRAAEMRHDRLVDELAVSFEGLWREITVAIEPAPQVFRDGHPRRINGGAIVNFGEQAG